MQTFFFKSPIYRWGHSLVEDKQCPQDHLVGRIWAVNSNPDSGNSEHEFQQPQEEGDTHLDTVRLGNGLGVQVYAHVCIRAATLSTRTSWAVPVESGYWYTLACLVSLPVIYYGFLDFLWMGRPRAEDSRSLPTLTLHPLIPGANPSLLLGSSYAVSPSWGTALCSTGTALMHISYLDHKACCEGRMGSDRGGREHD